MKVSAKLSVKTTAGTTQLAGATDGAAWFESARGYADRADAGIHAIDFDGIELATVSWLRDAILALQRYCSTLKPDVRFVVANVGSLVREELVVALDAAGAVIVAVQLQDLEARDPVLLGHLDPALKETLHAVAGRSEFDATFISKTLQYVSPSAANNRLAALEDRGVLTSERQGRARIYRPILEHLSYGY